MLPPETDVLVIGGGPAGLATALAARRHGLDVIVADRAQSPIDKACGEGLMPDGVSALRALGVEIGSELGLPFAGIRFLDDGLETEAPFPNNEVGLGIRRTRLQAALAECTARAGIRVFWQARVRAIHSQGAVVDDQTVRCRWIVGADGLHSRARDWAGATARIVGPRRLGVRQHFHVRPWTNFVEVYWHTYCQAYVTPTGPSEVCVAIIGREQDARMSHMAALFPRLARRLASAIPSSVERGALSTTTIMSAVNRGQIALVGDASGSVDAVTGEGLSMAFRQAQVLGAALARGNLTAYQCAHRRIVRLPRLMTRLLLLMDQHDGLRKRAMRRMSARPLMFNRLLAAHVGAIRPWEASREAVDLTFVLLASKALRHIAQS